MPVSKVLKATISKDVAIQDSNEDSFCLRLNASVPRAAVFDGASESYAARKWSRLVADEWGRKHDLDWGWIDRAQSRYERNSNKTGLSWAQEVASDRGSFATVCYVEIEGDWLNFCAVGDSCMFLLDGEEITFSYPYVSEAQFTSAPLAMSSRPDNLKMNKDNLHMGMGRLRFRAIGTKQILLATDAVSCWLLADDQEIRAERLKQLLNCKTPREFQQLVLEERANKNMHVDDSTVVLLRCS